MIWLPCYTLGSTISPPSLPSAQRSLLVSASGLILSPLLSSALLSTIMALFRIHCPTIFSNCNPSFPTPTFSLCAREPTRPFSSPVFSSPILMCNGQRHSFYCLLCFKLVLLSLFSNLVFLPHKRLNNSI